MIDSNKKSTMSTTTSKILYYLNRFTNLFLYQIKVVENELDFKINKPQVLVSSILSICYLYFITSIGFTCTFDVEFDFVAMLSKLSHFISLNILYLNALMYRKELKWVSNEIFQLDNVLKPEMKNSTIVKLYFTEKVFILVISSFQDILANKYWNVSLKCYIVGYLQIIPNALTEISYIFGLTKLENQIKACKKNLTLTHLDCLSEIKKTRRVLDSCYQIPIMLKLSMRFADSLIIFQTMIKHFMSIEPMPFEGVFGMLTWGAEVVTDMIFLLYLIQRNDDQVYLQF